MLAIVAGASSRSELQQDAPATNEATRLRRVEHQALFQESVRWASEPIADVIIRFFDGVPSSCFETEPDPESKFMPHETKRILITGASRGLGLAMTTGFVGLGHAVIGCAVRPAGVAALRLKFPPPHRFDVVDVADEVQVAGWAAAVLNDQGPPDLLLNNAGVINPNARLWEVSAEDFSRVIDVNVKGVFHVVRHFVPAMIRRGSGVIVNFSSGWGRSTSPEVGTYCASKWAIEGLTRALADELPSGMAAIPLNPGIVNTDMLQSCFGPHASGYPGPEQWAQKVVPFLLELGPADSGDPLTAPS